MTHYPVTKPIAIHNDLADQWVSYLQDGYSYEDVFEYIPVSKVDFDLWNKDRYAFYMEAFKKNKAAKPIQVSLLENGRYSLVDGNHRTAASRDMGYSHVPAIVSKKVMGKPSPTPPANLKETIYKNELSSVLITIQSKIQLGMDFTVEWGGASSQGYWFKLTDERERPYYTTIFVVKGIGDKRSAQFDWHGEKFRYQWSQPIGVGRESEHFVMVSVFEHFMTRVWGVGRKAIVGSFVGGGCGMGSFEERLAKKHMQRQAVRSKTAGEVRFVKDRSGDDKQWGWPTPGPSERTLGKFEFNPKNLKPLAETLRATLLAMGHALSAYTSFTKLKSAQVSPDGSLGGKGYIQKITEMRRAYMNACEALSALSDTLYDEIHAPHWDSAEQAQDNREREKVKDIMDDVEEIRKSPEDFAEKEEESMDDSPKQSKQASRIVARYNFRLPPINDEDVE
jgi:hypothetical protein